MTGHRTNIVRDHITLSELTVLAESRFGDLVKGVVDLDREIMAVGEGMHADEEAGLLADGSRQNAYQSTAASLDAYFLPFAVAARRAVRHARLEVSVKDSNDEPSQA